MVKTRTFYLLQGKESRSVRARLSAGLCRNSCVSTYVVSFGLKHIEHQRDAILNGRHQLPHAVLVGGVFFGPPGGGEGAIQFGDEPTTRSC